MPHIISYQIEMVGYAYRHNQNGITANCRKYPKVVDTIWITEKVLSELDLFNIKVDKDLYRLFLGQVLLNGYRLLLQSNEVQMAAFDSAITMFDLYFARCTKSVHDFPFAIDEIEKSLILRSYSQYKAAVRWLH